MGDRDEDENYHQQTKLNFDKKVRFGEQLGFHMPTL